jgi:hypothetical protein
MEPVMKQGAQGQGVGAEGDGKVVEYWSRGMARPECRWARWAWRLGFGSGWVSMFLGLVALGVWGDAGPNLWRTGAIVLVLFVPEGVAGVVSVASIARIQRGQLAGLRLALWGLGLSLMWTMLGMVAAWMVVRRFHLA